MHSNRITLNAKQTQVIDTGEEEEPSTGPHDARTAQYDCLLQHTHLMDLMQVLKE